MTIPINLVENDYPLIDITPIYTTPVYPTPAECPKPETGRIGNGQGPKLGLRRPWYNDLSHEITDSTPFRILMIVICIDWIAKRLGVWN